MLDRRPGSDSITSDLHQDRNSEFYYCEAVKSLSLKALIPTIVENHKFKSAKACVSQDIRITGWTKISI